MERMKYFEREREREKKDFDRQGSLRWKIEGWEQTGEKIRAKKEEVASRCQGDNSVLEIFPNYVTTLQAK